MADNKKRFAVGSRAAQPRRTSAQAHRVDTGRADTAAYGPDDAVLHFDTAAPSGAGDERPASTRLFSETTAQRLLPEVQDGTREFRALERTAVSRPTMPDPLEDEEPELPEDEVCKKNVFAAFAGWLRASARNRVILFGSLAALAAIVVLILSAPAITPIGPDDPDAGDVPPVEELTPGQSIVSPEEADEYGGVLLPLTVDAGEDYLAETLFIGDSNTARIQLYGFLTLNNVIGIESMGIGAVPSLPCVYFSGYDDPVTIPQAVGMMQPRRIALCFGTNNLATGNTDAFIAEYETALASLHEAYPYADIMITAIPPISESVEGTALRQEAADEYNHALLQLAKDKGYRFLDTAEALKGEDGYVKDNYIIEDGIHLSKTGLQAWLRYVRTHALDTEDTRPTPLEDCPARRPAPVPETEDELDTGAVVSKALALFYAGGFKEPTDATDLSRGTEAKFSVPYEQKGGAEEQIAKNLFESVKAQTGMTSGYVGITVRSDDGSEQHVFTIRILPDQSTCTHTFSEWVTLPGFAACAPGERTRTCSKCGFVEKETVESTTAHTFTTEAPTFHACLGGEYTRTCSVCKFTETVKVEPTAEHTVATWTVKTEATCTAAGSKEGLCSVCNTTARVEIPAKGHTMGAWSNVGTATPPTCTAEGSQPRERTCSVCGHVESEVAPVPALGHSWSAWASVAGSQVASTCTTAGSEKQTRSCSVCGAVEEQTVSLPMASHTDGNADGSCDSCGAAMTS